MTAVRLDVIQLHGNHCATPPAKARVWRSVVLPATVPLDENTEAFLLDSPSPHFGGSGRTFDWSLAAEFPHRAILAGGLDASNVAEAIRAATTMGRGCMLAVGEQAREERSRREYERSSKRLFEKPRCGHSRGEKNMNPTTVPDTLGHFGPYGGRYVPEVLMSPLEELEKAYAAARAGSGVQR